MNATEPQQSILPPGFEVQGEEGKVDYFYMGDKIATVRYDGAGGGRAEFYDDLVWFSYLLGENEGLDPEVYSFLEFLRKRGVEDALADL